MDYMKLLQRKLFLRREFTMNDEFLNIKSKDLTSSEEINVPYEEIDVSRLVYQKQTDNIMLIITIVFGTFFLINIFNPENYNGGGLLGVAIFLFFVTAFSGIITFVKSKNITLIPTQNHGYLEVFRNKPSSREHDGFISELSKRVTSLLKTKYGKVDMDMPVEPQLMNFAWLKERGVISEEEFNTLKYNLIGKENTNNQIGFNK